MSYLVLKGSKVVNVIECTPEYAEKKKLTEAPPGVGKGWKKSGDTFTPPKEAIKKKKIDLNNDLNETEKQALIALVRQ